MLKKIVLTRFDIRFNENKAWGDLLHFWNYLAPTIIVMEDEIPDDVFHYPAPPEYLHDADIILVLGSNDVTPAYHAAILYHDIYPYNSKIKIIACGRGGHPTVPGPLLLETEAEHYRYILMKQDVPAKDILIEPDSTNSGENINNARDVLYESGFPANKVIIIQTPSLQLKATLTFEKEWSKKFEWDYYISAPPPLPNLGRATTYELKFYLACALRELATTINYSHNPKYNYQTKRDVPDAIVNLIVHYYREYSDNSIPLLSENYFNYLEEVMLFFRKQFKDIFS
ncbi:YdcF family protein [Candidatus Margulisiibacteriota bacterium]